MMKNKNLKEVICGVIAVAAVFLSACGQTNDKKLDSTPEPGAEAPQETEKPEINVPGLTINDTDKIVDQFSKEYDKLLVFLDFPNNKVYIKNEEINLLEYDYEILREDESSSSYFLTKYSGYYYVGEELVEHIMAGLVLTMGEDAEYIFIESSEPTLVKKQG